MLHFKSIALREYMQENPNGVTFHNEKILLMYFQVLVRVELLFWGMQLYEGLICGFLKVYILWCLNTYSFNFVYDLCGRIEIIFIQLRNLFGLFFV